MLTGTYAEAISEEKQKGSNFMRSQYRYYDFIMVGFVTILLCANLIGVGKVTQMGGYTFGAGVFFFPISYLFGDILTEVYGYARSRRVVWAGFGALAFATFYSGFILALPPAPHWQLQTAYESVFGQTPRIVVASLLGFWIGEFANSFTLAKMKILTRGKHLWMRTIGSTIVGEAFDSLVFYPIAFYGVWETPLLIKVLATNYSIKVLWEVLVTPVTYRVVAFLKKAENVDYYDKNTQFTPFSVKLD